MVKTVNTDFFLKVLTGKNLYNVDGAGFKCYYLNESTGDITQVTEPFSEIISNVSAETATLSSDVEGLKILPVDDIGNIKDGDVINIDNSYYYIESISGNNIYLNVPCDLHSSGATVTTVGNTGIYKVKLNIPDIGDYTAFVSNANINMQNHSCSISIRDVVNDDIATSLTNLNDEITRSSFV